MSITVSDFDRNKHLDAAAMLLAERQRRDRDRDPRFPAAFEVPAACKPSIEEALGGHGAHAVIAKQGDDIVGFAVMSQLTIAATHFLASFFPQRSANIGYGAHAVADGLEYDAYREMYAVLADRAVSLGFFDHQVNLSGTDAAARDAFVSLGFGQTMAAAVRNIEPTEKRAASIDVHTAAAEDAKVVYDLSEELTLHHARTPIFNPYIRESDESAHQFNKDLLAEPEKNAHWVGYEGGKPVGMNTFMAPVFMSPMTIPEKTVYLFQGIVTQDARAGGVGTAILSKGVAWAREQGYEYVGLHFATSNLSGAKFWQSSGFKPVEYGMRRHIDERIAWANR